MRKIVLGIKKTLSSNSMRAKRLLWLSQRHLLTNNARIYVSHTETRRKTGARASLESSFLKWFLVVSGAKSQHSQMHVA
jgi:hypothetical protein